MSSNASINQMKIDVYRVMHPRTTVQKGLFNRDYRYAADLFGDRLRTPVDKYALLTGMEIMWTQDTVYYKDARLTPFIDAIMTDVGFRTVAMEKEVLKADADWKLRNRYRVLVPRNLNLDPADVEKDELLGEILSIPSGAYQNAAGQFVNTRRVVGFLSDCADSAMLLKMKHQNVIFEESSLEREEARGAAND